MVKISGIEKSLKAIVMTSNISYIECKSFIYNSAKAVKRKLYNLGFIDKIVNTDEFYRDQITFEKRRIEEKEIRKE